jgi:phosphotransferase system HPr-like phosphotransfer protein
MQLRIKIDTIAKVKDFVSEATAMPFDITLKTGRYVVDAKSLMAIFSLDIEKPIVADFDTEDEVMVLSSFGKWEDKE